MSTSTIEETGFLSTLRQKLADKIRRQNDLQRDIDELLEKPQRFKRDLNDAESAKFDKLKNEARTVRDEIAATQERIAELEAMNERRNEANRLTGRPVGGARVTREGMTYTARSEEREGVSFLRDLVSAQLGDYSASERLQRHAREMQVERRDIGTSALAGLVPPTYLTDLVAELARAGRPLANVCRSWDLPPKGMTVEISRVTTGSAVAAQATQNTAVQETDMDDTQLSVAVNTIAGAQDVSRQVLERGVGVDALVFGDLAGAYGAELDRQCIATSGASGTHLGILSTVGINAITYTDASPTVAELWPKIADAANQVAVGIYRPADTIIMHPRRWAWIVASLGTDGRPLVDLSGAPMNVFGTGANSNGGGFVGRLQGLDVVLDANVPTNLGAGTNEDRVIIAHRGELHLWEDQSVAGSPMTIRAEQVGAGSLTVKLVVYGYSAFTAGRRPTAVSVISGTGLTTPAL